ncbi:MAG: aminotransferase class I/II-fold pyridoxal phosphate-dependent enzyme, partial [Acidimicrobiaceae bacterium]|nr:aminotransferase class I/II-fold pyridoxal phosphate-dependent enzyme [Acidimicrobiaceae bacterium]
MSGPQPGASGVGGFVPPAYPYDRLLPAERKAAALDGGVVDLSIGTPTDPPPAVVLEALAQADERGGVRGYPASIGSAALRGAIREWTEARLGVELPAEALAACVGTKEFVATLPQWLK